ncbi:MAG: hypothetical protein QOI12_264 [Alphaproteobacteria bacterium]|jgi:uncharacterized protein YndB with AHSA1/START domain|nr:hypothetical protein [Alphaproteobacteria bacterium]
MGKPVTVTTPSDREVTVVREFDAPARLIWDAHTTPELMKRWLLGPPGWSMPHCTVDLRVGGRYRYVWKNDETGAQFGAYGEHREVAPFERIVTTENMDGLGPEPFNLEPRWGSEAPSVNTLTLAEAGGKTTLTLNMCFPSKQIRDMAVRSGMSDGMAMGYDRLEAMAAEFAASGAQP